jgi:membrane protease YdiL (CAAX protease family)
MATCGSPERRLACALAALAAVSLVLLAASCAAPRIGTETALLGGFGAAAALAWLTRPSAPRAPQGAIAGTGLAVGLPPRPPGVGGSGAPTWIAVGVLAPVFEELLYRERLIPALRAYTSAPLAITAASALFALPHGEAWSALGSFLVGLALGALQAGTGAVSLCIAAHAGLNAASLVGVALVLGPTEGAALGAFALAAALTLARRAESAR